MLQNFLSFDKLIGTKLIKILYYLGLIGIVITGLATIIGALKDFRYNFFSGLAGLIGILIGLVIALVFWRFLCEIYMLFFRMSDDLRDIKNHQLGREANSEDVNIDL